MRYKKISPEFPKFFAPRRENGIKTSDRMALASGQLEEQYGLGIINDPEVDNSRRFRRFIIAVSLAFSWMKSSWSFVSLFFGDIFT
jgi:hypothetical protein